VTADAIVLLKSLRWFSVSTANACIAIGGLLLCYASGYKLESCFLDGLIQNI